EDLSPAQGTVAFKGGQSTQQLQLQVVADKIPENDETLLVRLTQAEGGSSVQSSGNRPQIDPTRNQLEVLIKMNDAPIRFTQMEYRVDELNYDQTLFVEVTRGIDDAAGGQLGPIEQPATVQYVILPVSCTPEEDFIAQNSTLVFSSGSQTARIAITILSDMLPEEEEVLLVQLINPQGDAVVAQPTQTSIVINANDDPNGVISIAATDHSVRPMLTVNEDQSSIINVDVIRNGGTFGEVSVDWFLESNYTRLDEEEVDIEPSVGRLTFAPGEGQKTLVFNIIQDNIPEPAEVFVFQLIPSSVTGGARAEGILVADLVIEDSDGGHGVVQFNPDDFQTLDSTENPRRLVLSLSRTGGSIDVITIFYDVEYVEQGIDPVSAAAMLVGRLPGSIELTANQASYTVEILIREEAFLHVGAHFNIHLTNVKLGNKASTSRSFNSPKLGSKNTTRVQVGPEDANGEIGFEGLQEVNVHEPDDDVGITEVILHVARVGTNGEARVSWRIEASGSNPDHITSEDLEPRSGTIAMQSGESLAALKFNVLADQLSEMDETLKVILENAQPRETQRLRVGYESLNVVILENDYPGGVFEISESTPAHYDEEVDVMEITVVRTGGALVPRELEYYIEPNGEEEFYGSLNVIKFRAGEVEKKINVIARKDGVPELTETFTLKIRSFGEKLATIGARDSLGVTVAANEQPYGQFQFPSEEFTVTIDETKGDNIQVARLAVERFNGRFDQSNVTWTVEDNVDLTPQSGSLVFDIVPFYSCSILCHASLLQIPEGHETFTVTLTSASGLAILGNFLEAFVAIRKNDDAIYFKEPSKVRLSEPGVHTFTVFRDGPTDRINSIDYKTVAGDESEEGSDYVPIQGQLLFDLGETEKQISIEILGDDFPEPDEEVIIMLFNPVGDVSAFYAPNATVTIAANDQANGVFRFVAPFTLQVKEEQTAEFEIIREVGHYYAASVFYEILRVETNLRVSPGEDFVSGVGFAFFKDNQELSSIEVTPINDEKPEFEETFKIRLLNVTVDKLDLQSGVLADVNQEVILEVKPSNDPNGYIVFPLESREISVAEDVLTGSEASTLATLQVQRQNGAFDEIQVAWEAFSYRIAGAGGFPPLLDLLFLGQVPDSVTEKQDKQRRSTGTLVLQFDGCTECYVRVPSEYQPSSSVIRGGFSISAWLQTSATSNGYIVAKTTDDGQQFYALKVSTVNSENFDSLTIEFRYSTVDAPNNQVASASTQSNTADGRWHLVVASVLEDSCTFYVDGVNIGTATLVGSRLADGVGSLLVGTLKPGIEAYQGLMQDVRIFTRTLDEGEVREIYLTPSVEDLSPISGYLTFPDGVRTKDIMIQALQDIEEESNELFDVKIISAKGGARISDLHSSAVLTVLKSDNANGLFGFSGACALTEPEGEASIVECMVSRSRGDADFVKVTYNVMKDIGTGMIIAHDDFVNATGSITFQPGERLKLISVQVLDDMEPEVPEDFEIHLVETLAEDGLVGSTATSGASIDPLHNTQNISLPESDFPFGLIEFSASEVPPQPGDPIIPPATQPVKVNVLEEEGVVSLLVVRAQGLLGDVLVEWRTVDGSARSAGKTPPDFEAQTNLLSFMDGQRYATIDIIILDNDIPESSKSFTVQLLNPSGGAAIGIGSEVEVNIQHSDQAFGVFMFADYALFRSVEEVSTEEEQGLPYSDVGLAVARRGGTIGSVNITWEIQSSSSEDFLESSGTLTFNPGQDQKDLVLRVRDDVTPELEESFWVILKSVSRGSLGEEARLRSNLKIIANDNPYGTFVIPSSMRPIHVDEDFAVATITVERSELSGSYGTVRVDYSTLNPWESFPYLPGSITRASITDFFNTTGSLVFEAGEKSKHFNVTIREDLLPEIEETIFARLTGAHLLLGMDAIGQYNSLIHFNMRCFVHAVKDSPKLGSLTDTYAQIIINKNDDPHGVLELSASEVMVSEEFIGTLVEVVRKGGSFGTVQVQYATISQSAIDGLDFSRSPSSDILLLNGETSKAIPVEIVNDRVPELRETFVVRLLDQVTGGATLGDITEAVVTITESDQPYGSFGFESESMIANEPETENENSVVEIPVIRRGGSRGVVAVKWEATYKGETPSNDISPTSGTVYFVSNEARQMITLSVLHDEVPEGLQDITFTLTSANNGGVVDMTKKTFTLQLLPNDNPYGTVQFPSHMLSVDEGLDDSQPQTLPVARVGGNYGRLLVSYVIRQLDLVDVVTSNSQSVFDFYNEGKMGAPSPNIGTTFDVENQVNPYMSCASICLVTEACRSFAFSSEARDCIWYEASDYEMLDNRTGYTFRSKNMDMISPLYEGRAAPGKDFQPSQGQVFIEDGFSEASIPVIILSDVLPELPEYFTAVLTNVELVGMAATNPSNLPQLGTVIEATVAIAANDDANGIFHIYSNDPRAQDDGHKVMVEERGKLAVELIVHRQGGTIGTVSVAWFIDADRTTASRGADYIADGATLTFQPGESMQTVTLSIVDDAIPEDDEVIFVGLRNADGGASIAGNAAAVEVVLMANDFVGGQIRFKQTNHLVNEGDLLVLQVIRSSPGLGTVSVDWSVQAVNSDPPERRFRIHSGTLFFQEGELERIIQLHVLVDNEPKINQEYQVILFDVQSDGVRETGQAELHPQNAVAVVTIEGGNEPHGVVSFALSSLDRTASESENTIQLTIDRKFGSIGTIQVHYDVKGGYLVAPSENTVPASPDIDFRSVSNGVIALFDGDNSGLIYVQLMEDEIPEVDEVFLVNLTRVELIEPSYSTFRPKLGECIFLASSLILIY
ncbi:hypothetical protein CAPTEDRAFT_91039, partial [Capitella teleta]